MKTRFAFAALVLSAGAAAPALADPSALGLLFSFDSNNTAGWTQSMARNDDGSSGQITLPFNFCFYEQDRNSLFINNNGNVSFNSPFSSFTSTGFPVNGFDMIAPFWADVDTRNTNLNGVGTNLVWHRTFDTNSDLVDDVFVVTWDAVGFFPNDNSLRNTFQLALAADENHWGAGLNGAFSYGDMNWTTGSASGGSGGFGGTPATVGINRGNGIDFAQVGRFNHAGNDYQGQFGNSGVDFLDGFDFFFDACQGNVPTPGAAAVLGLGALVATRRRRA